MKKESCSPRFIKFHMRKAGAAQFPTSILKEDYSTKLYSLVNLEVGGPWDYSFNRFMILIKTFWAVLILGKNILRALTLSLTVSGVSWITLTVILAP